MDKNYSAMLCAAATIELISLRARQKKVGEFATDPNVMMEFVLLGEQIFVLEATITTLGGKLPKIYEESKK